MVYYTVFFVLQTQFLRYYLNEEIVGSAQIK